MWPQTHSFYSHLKWKSSNETLIIAFFLASCSLLVTRSRDFINVRQVQNVKITSTTCCDTLQTNDRAPVKERTKLRQRASYVCTWQKPTKIRRTVNCTHKFAQNCYSRYVSRSLCHNKTNTTSKSSLLNEIILRKRLFFLLPVLFCRCRQLHRQFDECRFEKWRVKLPEQILKRKTISAFFVFCVENTNERLSKKRKKQNKNNHHFN